MTTATDRLHALDATRAFALLLGIVLHATMSFFLPIPAQDVSQSAALAGTFYVIHMFRMALFFVVAGFFARLLVQRRGWRGFARDRARRIGVPMTAGWLLLAPVTIGIVLWGLSRTFAGVAPADAPPAPAGFPLLHLWFLYYLALFYVLAFVAHRVVSAIDRSDALRARIDGALRIAMASWLAPVLLALPTLALLYADTSWPVWFGVPTPEYGLLPKPLALVAFGTAFGVGWLLQRQVALLAALARQWTLHLAVAVACTVACLWIVGPVPTAEAPNGAPGDATWRLAYVAAYTIGAWSWVFGLLGVAMRYFAREDAVRRYLADASYFLYLAHIPVVFGLQVALMRVPLHWSIKFPLIVALSLGVLLATYHVAVRSTFLGELLNGRRHPRGAGIAPGDAVPMATTVDATVARLDTVTKRYGKATALDALSLDVRPGELLAVLGPNGAGKSTAIGLWLGTLQADAGSVEVLGGSPLDVHSRLGVGVMLQDVALSPELNAREHIALVAGYYRDPLGVDDTIAIAGIAAFAGKRYGRLSGGQKRQVQFALAVCGRPRLLFLDEPTVGLDVEARQAMWRTIRRLVDDGCAVVLTTHYLEEAEALADRVAVLAKGRRIAEGTVDEMRSLVARKRISCACDVDLDTIRHWAGVVDATREHGRVHVTASDAEGVVVRLFGADPALRQLEVRQASLADAFTELTKDAA